MFRTMVYFRLFFTLSLIVTVYKCENVTDNSSDQDHGAFKVKLMLLCNKSPRTVIISGNTIKLSTFLNTDGTFSNYCVGGAVNVIYIFASRKIIMDRSIHAPGIDLFILAPTWQVVTMSSIDLNGLDGEFMPTPEPSSLGYDGKNGRPGNPGKPGGNFFGMVETVIDSQYLTISVSGGNGGPGQDGGVGGGGTDGRHALKANLSLTCTHSACDDSGTMYITALDSEYEYSEFKCKEEYNYIIYDFYFLPPVSGNVRQCSYYIYGGEGVVAGAGGDGGVGGIGGLPGEVYLIELFGKSEITTVNKSGKTGMEGRGNQGGLWSKRGWDVSFKKKETYQLESPYIAGTPVVEYIDSNTYVRQDQTIGVDGKNSYNITYPAPGEKLDFPKLLEMIRELIDWVNEPDKPFHH